MDEVKFVSTGSNFSFAVKTDGSIWTWGNNNYGLIGDRTFDSKVTPVKIFE